MSKVEVSILMAVYNAESFLKEALDSVLATQSFANLEVIAVDDASTDNSFHILQEYSFRDQRLKVLHFDENKGQAVARNEALKHAEGDYICMLDADDCLSGDAIESAVRKYRENPEMDCVIFRLLQHYPDGTEVFYTEPYQINDVITGEDAFLQSLDWTLHGLYMVRREIHLKYPFDDSVKLYSDDNTTRLHYLHSRRVGFCKGIYHYRKHAESSTTKVSVNRFLYMDANLSMRNILLKENVSKGVIVKYEDIRWLNYIGQLYFYYNNKKQFSCEERSNLKQKFYQIYRTFNNPYKVKFGYTWFNNYRLFLLQENVYFWLRKIFRPS